MKHTMCTGWGHAGCKSGRVKSYTVLQNVKSPIGQVVLYANEVATSDPELERHFFFPQQEEERGQKLDQK